MMRSRAAGLLALALLSGIVFTLAATVRSSETRAATASLTMSPTSQTLGPNQEFTITVKQNADVVTTGVNGEVNFTPGLLTLLDVAPAAIYDDGAFLVGTPPQTEAEAIAEANTTGKLINVAAYFVPGTGSVPAGEVTAFTMTFRTSGSLGGSSPITFTDDPNRTALLDNAGAVLDPSLVNALVDAPNGPTVTPSTTPTATNTSPPAATFTPTGTPTPSVTPGGPTLTPSNTPTQTPSPTLTPTPLPKTPATMGIDPATVTVPQNYEFTLNLVTDAPVETIGASADVKFNKTYLELLSVEKGAVYENGTLIVGGQNAQGTPVSSDAAEAITQANESTGILENLAVTFSGGGNSAPAGKQTAFILKFKSRASAEGTSDVELINCFYVPPTITPTPTFTAVSTATGTATASPEATPTPGGGPTQCKKPSIIAKENDPNGDALGVTVTNGTVKVDPNAPTLTPTVAATVVGTATVATVPSPVSTVAGSSTSPGTGSGASGLPNAGSWLGEDGERSLILGISSITLLCSLIALANTWIRRRKA